MKTAKRRQALTIRSLADFVALPDSELVRCLDAFRLAVLREKARREPLADTLATSAETFTTFEWFPPSDNDPWSDAFAPDTPLQDLPIRYDALAELKALNVYCVDDLAEISAAELRALPGMGLTTLTRLREVLGRLGLSFKPNPNPVGAMHERNRALQNTTRLPADAPIRPEAHVAELGLRGQTLSQLVRKGYTTVGALQALSLRTYSVRFGCKTALEVIARLAELGAPIEEDCSPYVLWTHGLLRADEVPFELRGEDPIARAAPWLGTLVIKALVANGLTTVALVVQAAAAGQLGRQVKMTARAKQATMDFLRERNLL